MTLLVRSSSAPAAIAPVVRESVRAQDPDLSVTLTTSRAQVDRALSQEWMAMTLMAVFGALALLLAVIGLHGVIAYAASQRVHEIGVRMALGARRTTIMTLVLREELMLAGFGVIAGLAGALMSTRLLTTLLHDVDARDPVTFGAAVALTVIVALVAGWLPARRAARVDPLVALREE
jgi:putative ABC transport system permease protein